MKTEIKYYKGHLDCQFSTIDQKMVGNSFAQKSTIVLEPRFRLYDPIEIDENEFISEQELETKPFLINKGAFDVEFYFGVPYDTSFMISGTKSDDGINKEKRGYIDISSGITNTTIKKIDEIVLVLKNSSVNSIDTKVQYIDRYVYHQDGKHTFYANFYANYGKSTHGKIHGEAFLKAIEVIEERQPLPEVVIQNKNTPRVINSNLEVKVAETNALATPTNLENNRGCFTFFSKSQSIRNSDIGPDGNLISSSIINGSNNKGCLGTVMNPIGSIMNPSLNAGAGNPGCLPSLGGGIGNGGCLKSLIGLILGALLTYLLMSAWLSKNAPAPQIIHDTVEVEVIKEKLDTLMILKTDTLSFVESTTNNKYETVNLPNVQFYTNSDVLIPSSAKELQQLAEYLVKNDSLNATVFGHTDNVGDPLANLKLSQRRAESVKNFLSSLGIVPNRITAKGLGDTQPKADNSKEEGRLMNRRVEVVLTNNQFVTTKRTQIPKDSVNQQIKK